MISSEWQSLMSLFTEREEVDYKRLKNNFRYLELCDRQKPTEEAVEEMYQEKFSKEEQIGTCRHYEGETEKYSMKTQEVYIQGMRDCFNIIVRLGVLSD